MNRNVDLAGASPVTCDNASRATRTLRLKSQTDGVLEQVRLLPDNPAQNPHAEGSSRPLVASLVPEGSRIPDVACGLGTNSVCLASRGEYFGTDVWLNFLRRASTRDLKLACSDGELLPFATGSFGVVILTYALDHCVEPVCVLREM
jgi:SAM-dependent methyltransferase